MKRSVFRLITLIGILLLGCTKFGKNFYVDGRVYNPITGKGVPDVEVALLRNKTGTLGTTGGREHKFSVFTDSDGYYKIEALAGVMQQNIQIRFTKEQLNQYYELGWKIGDKPASGVNVLPLKKGKKHHIGYEVLSYGYVKYIIHNVNCNSNSDSLLITSIHHQIPDYFIAGDNYYLGCYDYESEGSENGAPEGHKRFVIGDYTIKWRSIKNGVVKDYEKSFTLEEGELDTLEILY